MILLGSQFTQVNVDFYNLLKWESVGKVYLSLIMDLSIANYEADIRIEADKLLGILCITILIYIIYFHYVA